MSTNGRLQAVLYPTDVVTICKSDNYEDVLNTLTQCLTVGLVSCLGDQYLIFSDPKFPKFRTLCSLELALDRYGAPVYVLTQGSRICAYDADLQTFRWYVNDKHGVSTPLILAIFEFLEDKEIGAADDDFIDYCIENW